MEALYAAQALEAFRNVVRDGRTYWQREKELIDALKKLVELAKGKDT